MKMSKKSFIILSLVIALIFGISAYAYNEIMANKVEFKIYINGQLKEFSAPMVAYDGRTYLPIREFSEMLGFDVEWDGNDRSISITGDFGMADIYNGLSKEELDTVLKFKSIKMGDSLQDVFNKVGEPNGNIGSGMYIYIFFIGDNVEILLGSYNGKTVEYILLIVGEDYYLLTE